MTHRARGNLTGAERLLTRGAARLNDFASGGGPTYAPVSYTHLTLPTSDLVEISVVAVSLKKKKTEHMRVV